DRGKCGTALHLACDARAMPLGVVVTSANANDGCQTEDVLQALVVQPPVAEAGVPCLDPRDLPRARRPMELMAMGPRRNGRGGPAFGCKRQGAAKPSRGLERFGMQWSAAITSLRSSDGCSVASIARLVTTWDGSNWPHASSCSVRVLSHDP